MRQLLFVGIISICTHVQAKEWASLRALEKETGSRELKASDWLKSDRKQNTVVWQSANAYNLNHNQPSEYKTIMERRDFYAWYNTIMKKRGNDVIWPKMAHFISVKLRLIYAFPFCLFTNKAVKNFAFQGSETVFMYAFEPLKALLENHTTLNAEAALKWDDAMVYKEQYHWLENVYQSIDQESLMAIEHMAKGQGFYKFLVPKDIRFKSDITVTKNRYYYARYVLRDYCKKHYQ
ncbi:Insecticidal toxin complex protein [Pseudotamlana carrageenivorans]|uniref:Insecticidal toxin complex protein n=1 Tax=Pseudotamlana carrageenivorans TaxID=2069432 RepID=A0A2I7SDV3_9FLAO|nr:Insecticidal toxin complex protein [Tamlana carrageenivorans]AUS04071.1 Insecticidal toxin complex protein [Tamlana carrageenivorans]